MAGYWGSHLPVLIKVVQMTTGPVLECGSGVFSSPFLHWECFRTKRRLLTLENFPQFYNIAKQYNSGLHEVRFITDWDAQDLSEPWSVVLIDHEPGERRGKEIKRLLHAEYIVAHDAKPRALKGYGYIEAFAQFKYQYLYKGADPFTMLLSNKHDLAGFTI